MTREGRALFFPNVYQHRVEPFELADKTRPGHRKIVALFLVDPSSRSSRQATCPRSKSIGGRMSSEKQNLSVVFPERLWMQ
jgi:hypothetical protein